MEVEKNSPKTEKVNEEREGQNPWFWVFWKSVKMSFFPLIVPFTPWESQSSGWSRHAQARISVPLGENIDQTKIFRRFLHLSEIATDVWYLSNNLGVSMDFCAFIVAHCFLSSVSSIKKIRREKKKKKNNSTKLSLKQRTVGNTDNRNNTVQENCMP